MDSKTVEKTLKHPLMLAFLNLKLPLSQCLLFGSGPMSFYGLREIDNDLDFVLVDEAWRRACCHFRVLQARSGVGLHIKVIKEFGVLEFFDSWHPGNFPNEQLFNKAYVLPNGLHIASLSDVLTYKRILKREKDICDIYKIEDFLKSCAG